jgi:hypothetical protein
MPSQNHSYKQTFRLEAEEGYGTTTKVFVVADSYDLLFNLNCPEINIFKIDDTNIEAKGKVGGTIESELTFNMIESQAEQYADYECIDFVKQGRNTSNIRLAAYFINPSDPPQPEELEFFGLIIPEFECEDITWSSEDWGTNQKPVRTWKIKANPYSSSVVDIVSLKDLVEGTTVQFGLNETWETANVADRPGYYYYGNKSVRVDKLVSLNKVLRQLADNLQTEIYNKNLGNINIKFDRVVLDGRWYPMRWGHKVVSDKYPRYLDSGIIPGMTFIPDLNDYSTLCIDPDGTPTDFETIWISYRLFKSKHNEPKPSEAKQFRIPENIKTFTEFLQKTAENFSCFVRYYWTSSTELRVKFIPRSQFNQTKCYIKGAIKSTSKITAELMDKDELYDSYSTYLIPREGVASYYKNTKNDPVNYERGEEPKYWEDPSHGSSNRLLFTISPSIAIITKAEDSGVTFDGIITYNEWSSLDRFAIMPHNHVFYLDEEREDLNIPYKHSIGLHTAIYLYRPRWNGHPNAAHEPDYYFTPAVAVSFGSQVFWKLKDYLNSIIELGEQYYSTELNIDVPFWSGFSLNSDGSNPHWDNIRIGHTIDYDHEEFTVIGIKREADSPMTSLKLHAKQRFSADGGILTTFVEPSTAITFSATSGEMEIYLAGEVISIYDIVSLKEDGLIYKSDITNEHYKRLLGFALNSASAGGSVLVQTSGLIADSLWNFQNIGGWIYLNTPVGELSNWSESAITPYLNKRFYARVAQIVGKDKIAINFQEQFIYE